MLQLLMDAYGRIKPVDIKTMERIWEALRADNRVEIQGNHFATLINTYGCVQEDIDKAIAVFNSIPGFPRVPPRDAFVFEALINALVAHCRTDMPEYIALMHSEGVHMMAYIANFLIKWYADVSNRDNANTLLERLQVRCVSSNLDGVAPEVYQIYQALSVLEGPPAPGDDHRVCGICGPG
jgi:hypothetical protein